MNAPASGVRASNADWIAAEGRIDLPDADDDLVRVAGEQHARTQWMAWLRRDHDGVADYPRLHDVPGADATSHLSVALRWGHLHPRTVLKDLAEQRSDGARALARQIAWRDFFADVLWHRPDATIEPVRPEYKKMPVDEPEPDHDGRCPPDSVAAGPDRLPAGGRGDASARLPRAGCTTGSGWWSRRS